MPNKKFAQAVKKAKSLYKTGKYKNFASAVKAAYRTTAKKSVSAKPRKQAKKRSLPAKRKMRPAGKATVNVIAIGSIASHKAAIRKQTETKLGRELLRREKATTKRDKRKISKLIASTKRDLKRYC